MAEQKGRTKMGEEKAGVEGPSVGPSAPENAGIAEKMLAALLSVQESIDNISYFHAQIEAETQRDEARRHGDIRLNISTTVLNGLLCGRALGSPGQLAILAVQHADALLSCLWVASTASAPKEPPDPPEGPEAQR